MSPDDTSAAPDVASEAATAPPAFEPDHAAELADDFSNIDALIEQARVAAEAEDPSFEGGAPDTGPAAPPTPPPPASDDDHTAAIEALKARGYEVSPPAPPPPPPDPYADLNAQLAPLVGTADAYRAARDAALAPLPPLPGDTDPDWQAKFDAHQQAVTARDQAAAELARYDHARQTAGIGRDWARQRVLGELGTALEGLAAVYGLTPEQAARVKTPQTMSDAVAAVVEARDALWQAKVDELTKHWEGQVKRATVDRTSQRLDALGRGPAPASPPAGRPADGTLAALLSGQARAEDLSDEMIARAMRGELSRADLGA